jgi:hypothetical protein
MQPPVSLHLPAPGSSAPTLHQRRTAWLHAQQLQPAPKAPGAGSRAGGGSSSSSSRQRSSGSSPPSAGVLQQVALDVARSMHWDTCKRWSPAERSAQLRSLTRVLDAVFPAAAQQQFPFYVQGAHDVAGLLLLSLGEADAAALLQRLVGTSLRGLLQPTMAVPSALLALLPALLQACSRVTERQLLQAEAEVQRQRQRQRLLQQSSSSSSGSASSSSSSSSSSSAPLLQRRGAQAQSARAREVERALSSAASLCSALSAQLQQQQSLCAALSSSGPLPFALPWVLTWFSHSVSSLASAQALFDAFLCSHPLSALYASAALVALLPASCSSLASTVASCPEDEGSLFSALSALPEQQLGSPAAVAALLQQAQLLALELPPLQLLAEGGSQGDRLLLRSQWQQLCSWRCCCCTASAPLQKPASAHLLPAPAPAPVPAAGAGAGAGARAAADEPSSSSSSCCSSCMCSCRSCCGGSSSSALRPVSQCPQRRAGRAAGPLSHCTSAPLSAALLCCRSRSSSSRSSSSSSSKRGLSALSSGSVLLAAALAVAAVAAAVQWGSSSSSSSSSRVAKLVSALLSQAGSALPAKLPWPWGS